EARIADEGGVLGRGVHLEFPEEVEQLLQPLALAPLSPGGGELLEPFAVLGDVGRHGGPCGGGRQQEDGEGEGQLFHIRMYSFVDWRDRKPPPPLTARTAKGCGRPPAAPPPRP